MSIIYALVSKNHDQVLCEYTEYKGNFEQISRTIFRKIQKNSRGVLTYDESYNFSYINENNLTYLSMSDAKYPNEFIFSYLEDIQSKFKEKYTQIQIDEALSYSFNTDFKDVLKSKLEYYNNQAEKSKDSINKLKESIVETKGVLLNSQDILGQRGDKVNLIVQKADLLRMDSNSYLENAHKLKQYIMWRRIKQLCILIVIVLTIILIVYLLFK